MLPFDCRDAEGLSRVRFSPVLILGLILVSDRRAVSVSCKSANVPVGYQHCAIHKDGVHDLDCFGKYNSLLHRCEWKPGRRASETTYTLVIKQFKRREYCTAHVNISGLSQDIRIFRTLNMTAEVYENSRSTNCTKAVFSASPQSIVRCGPPYNASFRRRSGGLDVSASWSQEDQKEIQFYSVRFKVLGSPLWRESRSWDGQKCRVEHLNSSLAYSVQIRCVESSRCSRCVWSEEHTVPSELTSPPVIVNSSDIADGKGRRLLTVTWKYSSGEEDERPDAYDVSVGKASGEFPYERMITARPEIRLILSYSAYRLQISAVNNVSASLVASQMIPRRQDEHSTEAGKLNLSVHNSTSFTVSWGDDLIKNYVCFSVEWTRTGREAAFMSFYENENNYRTLSPLPEPLEPFKRYGITLHTRPDKETCNMKHVNNSESTYGTTTFYYVQGTPVGAPTNISAYNVTLKSAVLRWSSIAEDDLRGYLLGYVIHYTEYHHKGTSTERNITVDPVLNSYELRDLKTSTAYQVQISGFTGAGAGVRSKAVLFTTTQHQGFPNLSGIITVLAVVTLLLIFGSPVIKRTKAALWPSIPNPGNSNAMRKIEGACELELLESIYTLRVEEWDTNSLQIVEQEEASSRNTMPLLLHASEDDGDSAEFQTDSAEDLTGDVPAETAPGTPQTDHEAAPLAFRTGYTTMEMFQQAMPRRVNVSAPQESKPEETLGKSGPDYIRQFSSSPTQDDKEMSTIL